MATPLGNPGDLSPRARDILSSAATILAEDTRRSGLLLAACAITPKRFMSFHEHNEKEKIPAILEELTDGSDIALISDAGTPLVSDPGYLLVKSCRKKGIQVSPVPGPSAPIAALSASGLPPIPFVFLGFPPRNANHIRKAFAPYAELSATLIFFERKDRLAETLGTLLPLLGKREGCIAREITKTYEEFIPFMLCQSTIDNAHQWNLLGELTVILGPPLEKKKTNEKSIRDLIAEYKKTFPDKKMRELAKIVHKETSGWSIGEIYEHVNKP